MMGVLTVLLTSCESKFILPASSGSPYEMMVVVEDDLWERPAGRALFDVLDTDIPGLPQPERSFKISQLAPKELNQITNIFRNIIIVDIDPKQYTRTSMKYLRDKYSQPQVVLRIQSPNEADFAEYMKQHSQELIDFFVRLEMNRLIDDLEKKHSTVVAALAREKFGCGFWAPSEIKSSKSGENFFWTSSNTGGSLVNICMYAYPYEGPEIFNKQYVLAKRDSFMKANIPGSKPHMYMATDTLCTTVKPIVVKGKFAFETRGLWYMMNDAMGGPFVSHSRVDTEHNRVVVVEGFVYAPEKMKRHLIRRLEGALYTLCLPGEQPRQLKMDFPELEVVAEKEKK